MEGGGVALAALPRYAEVKHVYGRTLVREPGETGPVLATEQFPAMRTFGGQTKILNLTSA